MTQQTYQPTMQVTRRNVIWGGTDETVQTVHMRIRKVAKTAQQQRLVWISPDMYSDYILLNAQLLTTACGLVAG